MNRTQQQRSSAVVVGAGIGGLATAIGLRRIGWDVLVLERSAALREAGAGISLMANARRCLEQLGVAATVRAGAASMLPGGDGVRTPRGARLLAPADADFVHRHGLTADIVLRPRLQTVLASALPEDGIQTGSTVTGLDLEPGSGRVSVRVQTVSGTGTIEPDLLVGADGLHSTVRAVLWPDAPEPVYSGHSVWRGMTETRFAEIGGNTWGRGQQFGRMPLGDGRVYWYAVANTPIGERHLDERAAVLERFGRWHHPIPDLVTATPADTVLHHDIFELAVPLPSYVRGRAALLGDAAHAMTSDLGQGACQALEDAVVLCAALAAEPDIAAALRVYDQQRRPRAQRIATASRQMGQLTLMEGKARVLLRNMAVRAAPAAAGRRRLTEIGGWSPPDLPVGVPPTSGSVR